jgi:hypothetical protein
MRRGESLCWATPMSRPQAMGRRMFGIALVTAFTSLHCANLLARSHRSLWFADSLRLDMSLGVTAGALACAVVLSLDERNAGRAIVVLIFASIGALVGVNLGEPMWWGSYDHGGEAINNALFSGPLGAVAGYLLACMLLTWRRCRNNRPIADDQRCRSVTSKTATPPPCPPSP